MAAGTDDGAVLGSTTPRLVTPPLVVGDPGPCGCGCALTPQSSYGFHVDDFARDVLGQPLDPWQRYAVIHAGELLPDGRPRFRTVLILVARQNGKTHLLMVLTLFWLFVELGDPARPWRRMRNIVLGTSSKLDYAKQVWKTAVKVARGNEYLAAEIPRRGVRESNGQELLATIHDTEYQIAASNDDAGRSLSVDRLVLDELRQHHDFVCWDAAVPTTNAVPDAQVFAISNQGSDLSVVLDSLRESALTWIETGEGDPRLGLQEWSAPDGAAPTDPRALAAANPQYGRRIDPDALMGSAIRAHAAGGQELAGFRTEIMCQRVHRFDPAVDPDAWDAGGTDRPVDLAGHRGRVALCLDVALDAGHATLVAAAVLSGRVHVEVVAAWSGRGCTKQVRAELPGLVRKVRPKALGWFPAGPAAAIAADLRERRGWPPRGVELDGLVNAETTAVCMGLAEIVLAGELQHPRDAMLTAHVRAAQKLRKGDGWVFTRRGSTAIDGAYGLAGAVHLARILPPDRPPLVAL